MWQYRDLHQVQGGSSRRATSAASTVSRPAIETVKASCVVERSGGDSRADFALEDTFQPLPEARRSEGVPGPLQAIAARR